MSMKGRSPMGPCDVVKNSPCSDEPPNDSSEKVWLGPIDVRIPEPEQAQNSGAS